MKPHLVVVLACLALVVVMVADAMLPSYLPFRSLYLIIVAVLAWYSTPLAVVAAAVATVDLTFVDEQLRAVGAISWALSTRIVLYGLIVVFARKFRLAQRQLLVLALTDPLTGLANRRHFDELVEAELVRAWRYHHPVSIAMLDVNKFKEFNDTHGHVAGDNVLRNVAAELRAAVRATDTVARVGGDEFAILFPETRQEAAQLALNHVAARLAMVYPHGVSAGLSEHHPVPPSVEHLLNGSDQAMYREKTMSQGELAAPRKADGPG